MKHKWKVEPKPTGRYRSFDKRGWPSATYCDEEESAAARIYSVNDEQYTPSDVKTGNHGPLKVSVADHSHSPWKWKRSKGTFRTVAECKEWFKKIITDHPQLCPDKEE